jgi:hypothetical protein
LGSDRLEHGGKVGPLSFLSGVGKFEIARAVRARAHVRTSAVVLRAAYHRELTGRHLRGMPVASH